MATYALPLDETAGSDPAVLRGKTTGSLPEDLLVRNVLWFCHLRWMVVAIFGVLGCLSCIPGLLEQVGLRAQRVWPLAVAGVLALSNLAFLWHARRLVRRASPGAAAPNLWGQIVSDLVILTAVIYFTGTLETYIAFAYLFHIVLACIFFSRPASFLVTALACVLYAACVLAERAGFVLDVGIHADPALREPFTPMSWAAGMNVGSAWLIWLVVWYLASHLSAIVRRRDNELAETNRRLVDAQAERTGHMLRTTHELKAPLAAVHANVQRLAKGHCGKMPDEALEVIRRVDERVCRLAAEIQEMLQLANLRSHGQDPPSPTPLDLARILRWCTEQLRPTAAQRGVVIEEDLHEARTRAVQDQMKMLFGNLLANAVTYSDSGGRVRVRCLEGSTDGPAVAIQDDGIGIAADKLPHIFQPYYRTREAVRHNRESSGLGLAIVRHVAQSHGIRLRVTSAPGVGTTFMLLFPSPDNLGSVRTDEETSHGLLADY